MLSHCTLYISCKDFQRWLHILYSIVQSLVCSLCTYLIIFMLKYTHIFSYLRCLHRVYLDYKLKAHNLLGFADWVSNVIFHLMIDRSISRSVLVRKHVSYKVSGLSILLYSYIVFIIGIIIIPYSIPQYQYYLILIFTRHVKNVHPYTLDRWFARSDFNWLGRSGPHLLIGPKKNFHERVFSRGSCRTS